MIDRLKFIILILVGTLTACGEYELLEHHKSCKKTADSLFRVHRDSLTVMFDSLCVQKQEEYYTQALDSLTKTRIEDIQNLIKK